MAQVGGQVGLHGDWTVEEATQITVLVDSGVFATTSRPAFNTLTFVVPPLPDLDAPRSVPIKVKLGSELSNPVNLLVSAAAPAGNGAAPSPEAKSGIRAGL